MPNIKELESLIDVSAANPALAADHPFTNDSGVFSNYVEAEYYWTSTTNAADPTEAWTAYGCDFRVYDISKTGVSYSLAVR